MAKYASEEYICIVKGHGGSDLHHIYHQGSHPEFKDEPWNLLPVTHLIHQQIHAMGLNRAASQYKPIEIWLNNHNWTKCPVLLKWVHK